MPDKIAIMQPYVFPYLGYFSLLAASDCFVFYDDVAFKKKGWIHRNRILLNKKEHMFSIPLVNQSRNRLICDTLLHDIPAFRDKFLRQLEHGYSKALYRENGLEYVNDVLHTPAKSIAELAINSIFQLHKIIGITKEFRYSSIDFPETKELGRVERLIAISQSMGASCYLNAPGGQGLYAPGDFVRAGIHLAFVHPEMQTYRQTTKQFFSHLSVIDALMNCEPTTIRSLIQSYTLQLAHESEVH